MPASPTWSGRSCARWCPTRPTAGPNSTAGVLRTGVPIRFERELVATGRHLELAAFRIEPASRRQVAVLFQDITARKRADRRIQNLNETLEAPHRRGDRRTQAGRRGVAPIAEDGSRRPAHRRHRARLQQPPDRHHRFAGICWRSRLRQGRTSETRPLCRGRPGRVEARRGPDPSPARLLAPADAGSPSRPT